MTLLPSRLTPAALVALALALPAAAQEVTLRAGNIGVAALIGTQEMQWFADEVGTRSDGRIEIQFYPGGQLGTGQEQMEAVAYGMQDIYIGAISEASRMVPSFGVLDSAFLFKDEDHVRRFMASDMWATLTGELESEFGVSIITADWFDLPRYLLHRSEFILEPSDAEGVRVRSPGIPMYIQNYENMGASPITVAYGEQYLALSQGVVDMTESAADRILGPKLHEVAPFITEADMMFPNTTVFVNAGVWAGLSEEDRALITETAEEAAARSTERTREDWARQRAAIEAEGGQFQRMPEETRAAFADMAAQNLDEMEAEGLFPEGWYSAIQDLRDVE